MRNSALHTQRSPSRQSCYSEFALPKHGTSRTGCIVPHSILKIQNPRVRVYKTRALIQSLLGENKPYVRISNNNLPRLLWSTHTCKFRSSVGWFDFSLVSRNSAGDAKTTLTDPPASRALLALHSLDVFPSRLYRKAFTCSNTSGWFI